MNLDKRYLRTLGKVILGKALSKGLHAPCQKVLALGAATTCQKWKLLKPLGKSGYMYIDPLPKGNLKNVDLSE